jgi:SAM-dependent methyltransferase
MDEQLPLYADGRIYDQIFNETRDIPYWQEQLGQVEGPVLELSCGTGRILLEIAARGADAYGLDLSVGMLAYAAHKAEKRRLHINLHHGDMRGFELNQRFAAIYVPNNALGHLYQRRDIEAHLACVRRHLQPDGLYLLDMFVPNPALLAPDDGGREPFSQYLDPDDGSIIDIYQTGEYDHATQIKHATWSCLRNNQLIRKEPFTIRMFYPQELDALLIYNGFEIVAKYGGYDRSPFGSHSRCQLIVARAAQHG